ncbi:hypothetical protein RIF29_15736 [Crotalaria pallida]|uniref:Uncharacterized protein n=1 Tax=Crotalaria pallida TaxID=3830 RepID=A0AAN9FFC4_CROPI
MLFVELMVLNDEEVELRKSLVAEFWTVSGYKESMLAQKARSRWLKKGDVNFGFCHACLKSRRRSNQLVSLDVEGVKCDVDVDLADRIKTFFGNSYKEGVVEEKYGSYRPSFSEDNLFANGSFWWRDLGRIRVGSGVGLDWLKFHLEKGSVYLGRRASRLNDSLLWSDSTISD